MQRLLVTEAGDCFARFKDCSTLFLSSSCQIVVETKTNNRQTTRHIHFISDELKQKIEQMVNVRNRYFSSTRFPLFMMQKKGNGKQLLSPLTESAWTHQCQQSIKNQAIRSSDGNTLLELHSNQHQISISFPLCIKKEAEVTANGESLVYYHHTTLTQTQSIYNHDLCWQFPLFLLKNRTKSPEKSLNVINKMVLPQIEQRNSQKDQLSEECTKAIEYFHCMQQGMPPNQIIAVEWTPNAVHRVFNCPNYSVETFIFFDDSYLVSHQNQQFLHHFVPNQQNENNEAFEYVYSASAIPPIPPNAKHEDSYKLNEIAQNALNLLQNALEVHGFQQTATSKRLSLEYGEQNKVMSNEVKHYYIHPKVGEFTFYKDERVKVHFSDRTLLELSGDWESCAIITQHGEQYKKMDCTQPIQQFAKYIRFALNFAKWASLSTAERLKHEQNALKIQNDINKQIDFSQRLLETQQMTKSQDFSLLCGEINGATKSSLDNDELVNSIQAQLDKIDKLLK